MESRRYVSAVLCERSRGFVTPRAARRCRLETAAPDTRCQLAGGMESRRYVAAVPCERSRGFL